MLDFGLFSTCFKILIAPDSMNVFVFMVISYYMSLLYNMEAIPVQKILCSSHALNPYCP